MTDRFLGAMQMRMSALDGSIGQPRMGIVEQVDPPNHLAQVLIMPEQVRTGWLPIATMGIGPGFGALFMPSPGMPCLLVPDCGDASQMVVVGHVFSQQTPPPKAQTRPAEGPWTNGGAQTYANPGEMLVVARGGATFRINEDGTFYIQGDVYHQGNYFLQGDMVCSHNIAALNDINAVHNIGANNDIYALHDVYDGSGALSRLRNHYNGHAHIAVQAGPDTSGMTTQLDGAGLSFNAAGAQIVSNTGAVVGAVNSTGTVTSTPTISTLSDYASEPAQPLPAFTGGG